MNAQLSLINAAKDFLSRKLKGRNPEVGIVLGSGLGKLADQIEDPIVVPYGGIPSFPTSTAIGHKGNYICGYLGGKCVIAMQGRIHYYEGYGMNQVVLPIRVMIALGVKCLMVSNAAGGTNLAYHVGDLMIIKDHINLIPNPLIGPNIDTFGPRFPDMTRAYDPTLIRAAERIAAEENISLQKGVYVAVSGPCYETPAEYKFFRLIGGDAVGMSTVPEVIVARHAGVPVFGMSVITDVAHATDDDDYVTDGEVIVAAANAAADRMTVIFKRMIAEI